MSAAPAQIEAAYDLGQAAYNDGRITESELRFYRYVVTFTGETAAGYIWASMDYLASHFRVTVRTVTRWIVALVKAGLLRREYRPNKTALTSVPALSSPMSSPMSDPRSDPMSDPPLTANALTPDHQGGRPKAADVHPDPDPIEATPAVALLHAQGVHFVAPFAHLPVDQVQQAIDELNARGTDWGPGLLCTVLLRGLWRNWRRRRAAPKREATVEDLARSVDATQEQETAEHDAYYARLLANPDYCATCGTYTCGQCEHAGDG